MRRSLAGVAVAVTTLVAVAFLLPLAVLVGHVARDRVLGDAFRTATAVGPVLVVTTGTADVQRVLASLPPPSAGRTTVYLPDAFGTGDGIRARDVVGTPRARPADVARAARDGVSFAARVPGGTAALQPVLLDAGRVAVVEVTVPDAELNRGVTRARALLVALALALVAGSVAVADRLAGSVVRSARRLSAAAGRIGAGDLDARIDPAGPAELREAAVAFNTMAARVGDLVAAERDLAADLSHRLRTPLTALLLAGRALGPGAVQEQVRAAVAQLDEEIDGIIRRSREAAPARPARCDDVAAVLRERLEFWAVLAEDENRDWSLHAPDDPVGADVPADDLAAATDALLGNVFVHTPAGRPFAVTVRRARDGLTLVVDNAGPGIADAEGALRRGASGAGSTGLGLDIARRLAEGTGGTLRIGSSALGGARVELSLRSAGAAGPARPRVRRPRGRIPALRRRS